ncbi:hypothetical protein [Spirilliplanes yamanashiensis]|uniref:Uncharacterized protein n=1 Tax=Spirilliplanes yamanashiensis TaxID=42233 RepID=A0A8J3Y742_9ACTN|nr:hypothetical protein [Spirilliplanes yamanashiensis]MDP9814935.1 hypothetical protein [Spirilliplanes yamanashiensis]GIJ02589.1 hypothetical protein Sya03_19410 [Spirilliplanes yamanashiensis]
MTEQHTEVDLDLLADYIGGALDGTPDADRVGRLVAGDPAWQAAFDSLATGMTAVGAQLQALPPAGPLPDDVADRITAALAGLPELSADELARLDALAPEPILTHAPAPDLDEAPARHLHAVPGGSTARRRSRMRRFAAPIAVAAGVLAFAGIGANLVGGVGNSEDTASTAGGGQPAVLSAPEADAQRKSAAELPDGTSAGPEDQALGGAEAASTGTTVVRATGTDYTDALLGAAAPAAAPADRASAAATPYSASRNLLPSASVADELARLVDADAMRACLDAIAEAHGGGPITAGSVDFARYLGVPALVVRFTAADGTAWAWVSGPGCGTPGIGADTRQQVRVG